MIHQPNLYPMLFRRKSFHLLRGLGGASLTGRDLADLEDAYSRFTPLDPEIKTAIRIVPAKKMPYKLGQECCIYFYSEKKENYLQNIGFLGAQMELYCVSHQIASLWFGIGKTKEKSLDGLDFVIMMALHKAPDSSVFRTEISDAKRKSTEQLWHGEPLDGITEVVRYAPSSMNSQPWLVEREGRSLDVYRVKPSGLKALGSGFNRLDMGIFLCHLCLCLEHQGIGYRMTVHKDRDENEPLLPCASFKLHFPE